MLPRTVAAAALAAGASAADCTPQQLWVHFTEQPSEMSVQWATACASDATVFFGLDSGSLGSSVQASTSTYTAFDYTSPYLHHAIVSGLPLNTTVYYKVGGKISGWSEVANFTSHPGVGADVPVKFGVIGDMGQTVNSQDTLTHMMASSPSYTNIIHVGDLSYADDYEPRWDSWQNMVTPFSKGMPWMTLVGNHEVETNGNNSFQSYVARWANMPGNSQGHLYYSVNIGPVHWVMLSSYSDYSATSEQLAWFKADLAAVDRSKTPFVFVGLHAPWYNSNWAHQLEGEGMREVFEPVVVAGGVDAVFAGHVHAYERNYRTVDWKRNATGPYYITIGDGGNREGLAAFWQTPQPEWSAFRQASYGHGELVVNSTTAVWTWHQNPDLEPTVADQLVIVRGANRDIETHGLDYHVTGEAVFRAGAKKNN